MNDKIAQFRLLSSSEIAQFFANDEFDYDTMVKVLYPMVHPNITETIAGSLHIFVKLAIIPDFFLEDEVALCLLVLKP